MKEVNVRKWFSIRNIRKGGRLQNVQIHSYIIHMILSFEQYMYELQIHLNLHLINGMLV